MIAENIDELIAQLAKAVDMEYVYNKVIANYINAPKMYEESIKKPFTAEEIGKNFAYAGFLFGAKFAIENIEVHKNEE